MTAWAQVHHGQLWFWLEQLLALVLSMNADAPIVLQ